MVEREFHAGELGQGQKAGGDQNHRQARCDFLERCRVKFGPLPADVEEIWPAFRDWFATDVAKKQGPATGSWLLSQYRTVITKKSPNSFAKWVRNQWALKPKPANSEII